MSLIGTVLAGAIGTAVAQYFQNRTWKNEQHVKNKENRYAKAIELQQTISDSLDAYLYSMQILVAVIAAKDILKDDAQLQSNWTKFNSARDAWYEKWHSNLAAISMYFHEESATEFVTNVYEPIKGVDERVINLYVDKIINQKKGNTVDIDALKVDMGNVGNAIENFDKKVIEIAHDILIQ